MNAFDKDILVTLAGNGNELSMVELQDMLPGDPSFGAVYVSVDRLEESGFVQTTSTPGGPERGFRPKRIVRLTGHGLAKAKPSTN